MSLGSFLAEKREPILKKWFDIIIETYPPETARFLRSGKGQFTNPVAHTIREGMEGIFAELVAEETSEKLPIFLDNVIRIRAVQDFTPSQAISFVFALKGVIRAEVARAEGGAGLRDELVALESRIDSTALLCFDIFMKCREKIYDLKANEVRNMTFRMLERINKIDRLNRPESGADRSSAP